MIVQLSDAKIVIDFSYLGGNQTARRTVCNISYFGEAGRDIISTGSAVCYHKDQFNKILGRKVALTRAIRNFSRPDRKIIWHNLMRRCRLYKNQILEDNNAVKQS